MPPHKHPGLNALYYPFSRGTDIESLKQQLLLFDTISFLDPVDSEEWRAKLFRDLEKEHAAALEIAIDDLMYEIRKQLDEYSNELMSIRDNLWPKLLSNRNIISVAPALAAAVFLGSQFTLAASIIPTISIVQTILERRRERLAVERRASPALAYLAQVKALQRS